MLPLDAAAQITESLLPNAVPPSTPQTPTSAFAPLGLPMGDFFWYPRAELDQAYNSNIFATTTGYTYDLITALTSSFDLLSNFSRNSLNLHGGSLLQVYADHPAQNTQDGVLSADGSLDVTPGGTRYGSAQLAHEHISYGSPNSPGNIAQPVTYWANSATAGYVQGGRRFSYEVDLGVTSAQYNAALLDGGGVLPQSSQNATAYSAAVRGSYEIIPDYLGYIRFGTSWYDYWHTVPGGINPNFSTYRVDLGLQILPRH
ncbi:MAG: outer membrane beta-barrel protein, partial [Stellaceae bacterium]